VQSKQSPYTRIIVESLKTFKASMWWSARFSPLTQSIPHACSAAKDTNPQTKDPQTKEPQTKEPQTKEPQTKDPQTKDPQTKEPQTKEPQTKEPQTKDPQNMS
jgi:outer membrane biosynthesis protein TonB